MATMYSLSIGAAASPTPEQAAMLLAAGLQALPACYDRELDECVHGRPSKVPGCAAINAAYNASKANDEAMEKAVDALPFCAAGLPRQTLMVAGGGLLLAGFAVGVLLSRK